jgi:hypothetical protein
MLEEDSIKIVADFLPNFPSFSKKEAGMKMLRDFVRVAHNSGRGGKKGMRR